MLFCRDLCFLQILAKYISLQEYEPVCHNKDVAVPSRTASGAPVLSTHKKVFPSSCLGIYLELG